MEGIAVLTIALRGAPDESPMIGSTGLLEWVAAEAAPHAILWNCAVDIFSFFSD